MQNSSTISSSNHIAVQNSAMIDSYNYMFSKGSGASVVSASLSSPQIDSFQSHMSSGNPSESSSSFLKHMALNLLLYRWPWVLLSISQCDALGSARKDYIFIKVVIVLVLSKDTSHYNACVNDWCCWALSVSENPVVFNPGWSFFSSRECWLVFGLHLKIVVQESSIFWMNLRGVKRDSLLPLRATSQPR